MRPPIFPPAIFRLSGRPAPAPDEPASMPPRPRGSRRPHTDGKVAHVRRLIEQTTLTYGEIAARSGVGRASICRWTRDGGWQRPLFAPRATDTVPTLRASAKLKRRTLAARLPEAQRLAPAVRRIETRLAEVTAVTRSAEGLEANQHLLEQLTALAAELEAGAAASQFRFGASRAYDQILHLRLQTIGERKSGGLPTWTSFLARRMAPAIRTCATLEERQANLAEKLARAANLLRTRVDVELESQNRDVLRSMNERTRLQLMLQATVEGLSVAAISYYVVGLFGYLVKGAHDAGLIRVDPSLATGVFVPVAVALVWWIVRRIRKRHIKGVR